MSLDRPDRPEEAETLFAAWAVRAEAGEAVRIEDLLDAHPEHKEALTRLHEDWKLFAPLLGRAVPGKISEASGIVLAPITSHGKGDVEGPSPELIERLGINIPDSGRYRFRSVLGRGGGGVVLKVWDTKLNRALAMKVVLGRDEERPDGSTPRVDSRTLSRFVDEARIASQLNHPGIVPVHELGTDESGRVFFTMKLVKGEDLSKIFEHVKTGHDGWNQTRALNVLLRVCESLAFAHERGVIHRDLKPANIMVGRHGEVYVMDWGLARVLGEEDKRDVRVQPPPQSSALLTVRGRRPESDADSPLYTMDGDVVGTPAYMAPEQAAGRLDLMGPHSDVYAVGAMLYHLLAGHMPYVPEGARLNNYAVWQRVQEGPPTRLDGVAHKAPAELVAICEKAMNRDPGMRYSTTLDFARDLAAFLDGRVVRAFEIGAWAEGRKWVRRNRVLAATLCSLLVASTVGAISFALKAKEASTRAIELQLKTQDLQARTLELQSARLEAEDSERRARAKQYVASILGPKAALRLEDADDMRRVLLATPSQLRGEEWAYLNRLSIQFLEPARRSRDNHHGATENQTSRLAGFCSAWARCLAPSFSSMNEDEILNRIWGRMLNQYSEQAGYYFWTEVANLLVRDLGLSPETVQKEGGLESGGALVPIVNEAIESAIEASGGVLGLAEVLEDGLCFSEQHGLVLKGDQAVIDALDRVSPWVGQSERRALAAVANAVAPHLAVSLSLDDKVARQLPEKLFDALCLHSTDLAVRNVRAKLRLLVRARLAEGGAPNTIESVLQRERDVDAFLSVRVSERLWPILRECHAGVMNSPRDCSKIISEIDLSFLHSNG